MLEYLITYELVVQKAEELGVTVTDADVQTEIDTIVTSYYGGDQAEVQRRPRHQQHDTRPAQANYENPC